MADKEIVERAEHLCVGIRTRSPEKCAATVECIQSLGLGTRVIFETSKGTMAEVTNRLLDRMQEIDAEYYLIVDDDISFDKEVFHKAAVLLACCDAVSAMPVPDEPKLHKYYLEMYSRYKKLNVEPFTFSFALLKRPVVEQVRVAQSVDSREEHAFYRELVAHKFKYKSLFDYHPVHLGKTPSEDAKHNRWYAAGMAQIEKGYKTEALIELLLSPIEGLFYWALINDFFGFQHTVSLRYNACLGAYLGYQRRD